MTWNISESSVDAAVSMFMRLNTRRDPFLVASLTTAPSASIFFYHALNKSHPALHCINTYNLSLS
ncbi:unnamed protein product [Fusarium venenatum]|uniref:Uncharacterized protein n=1 Tax=Fusarium venenatum TaxID=56646 RepID=A0A2L2TTX3_9HYPO|nr:uncharacterized protein FVRRES_09114 [Fusarium venenatum]CEI69037.1 unnamed protein product [Fusarium venenatum]